MSINSYQREMYKNHLEHAERRNHKYLYKIGDRYIYPEDVKKNGGHSSGSQSFTMKKRHEMNKDPNIIDYLVGKGGSSSRKNRLALLAGNKSKMLAKTGIADKNPAKLGDAESSMLTAKDWEGYYNEDAKGVKKGNSTSGKVGSRIRKKESELAFEKMKNRKAYKDKIRQDQIDSAHMESSKNRKFIEQRTKDREARRNMRTTGTRGQIEWDKRAAENKRRKDLGGGPGVAGTEEMAVQMKKTEERKKQKRHQQHLDTLSQQRKSREQRRNAHSGIRRYEKQLAEDVRNEYGNDVNPKGYYYVYPGLEKKNKKKDKERRRRKLTGQR